MKSDRLLSLFLLIAGLGMGSLGLASVLAYPEFLAWLLLIGGVICLLFAVLIWVLPNDAVAAPTKDNGPNEPQPRKGTRFLVPVCAAAAAVIVFAVAASGGSGGSTREIPAGIHAPVETVEPLWAAQEEIQMPADEEPYEEAPVGNDKGNQEVVTLALWEEYGYPDPTGHTIYDTPTGSHYHYDNNCNGGNYRETTFADAMENGLTPCEKCVLGG